MAVSQATSVYEFDYSAYFHQRIIRSIQYVLSCLQQAAESLSLDDREQAWHTLSYSLKLPEAWPDTREVLLALAPQMEQAGCRDEWMPYLKQGIRQSQQVGDVTTEAELRFQLGILHQLRGQYDLARGQLQASADMFAYLEAPLNQAQALSRLAYVARLQRQFEEATALVRMALELIHEENSERAYCWLVLGTVALDRQDYPEARGFFEQSLSLWEQAGHQRMVGWSLINLGLTLEYMKAHEEAQHICQKAISVFEEVQDPVHRALAQMNLGLVSFSLDQPMEALNLFLGAKRVFHQTQDQLRLALVTHNIGRAYRLLKEWTKAEEAYRLSIEYKAAIGNVASLVNSMDGLGLLYLEQRQAEKAYALFEEARKQLASIEGEPGYNQLVEMVTQHIQQAFQQMAETGSALTKS
jgi:tetratricopeptide (TPR) repeat protein